LFIGKPYIDLFNPKTLPQWAIIERSAMYSGL